MQDRLRTYLILLVYQADSYSKLGCDDIFALKSDFIIMRQNSS